MSDLQKEKEELIEMFGIHFETHHNLSPLSSRILGTLIVSCSKTGLTFEELVSVIGASKSSVSTNLNLLLKLGKIEYYTVHGDRKKYFRASSFGKRMQTYLEIVQDEKKMVERMVRFRSKCKPTAEETTSLRKLEVYKEHVNDFEVFLNNTIQKLDKIENN